MIQHNGNVYNIVSKTSNGWLTIENVDTKETIKIRSNQLEINKTVKTEHSEAVKTERSEADKADKTDKTDKSKKREPKTKTKKREKDTRETVSTANVHGEVMLAKKFDPEKNDPSGWLCTEKIDGVRAYWNHVKKNLYTRTGSVITCPKWFKENLPKHVDLDGELWIGYGQFNKVNGLARKHVPVEEDWKQVKYIIFDVPVPNVPYEERVAMYTEIGKEIPDDFIEYLVPKPITDLDHLMKTLVYMENNGAEGLMIRKPGSMYERKRSGLMLKVKSFEDDEGIIIGYAKGQGKYKDMVGTIILKHKNGQIINLGSGLTDEVRENPPPLGTMITYKFFEETDGIPRFPVYVGPRYDI
jgi:DNA ligase-1